jgi:CRISPR-associated protein Cmr3
MRKLIRLKPLGFYFFGGNITFSDDSYIATSRKFPQQTTILGMLRKTLLLQNNLLSIKRKGMWVDDYVSAKKLVGDMNFSLDHDFSLGVIKKISPLFFIKDNQKFIYRVKDLNYENGYFKNYNPKDYLYEFRSIDNTKRLTEDDVFLTKEQIGINKKAKEDGFYKKISFNLKDFEFAFYVEFENKKFTLKDCIVELGGERSVFKMRIDDTNEWLEYKDENNYTLFLSEMYITKPIKSLAEFGVTFDEPFGYLQRERNKFKKTKTYYLYKRGGFLINPKNEFFNYLNATKHLQKIGLNIISRSKNES